jgi:hypothetical protein
LFYLGEGVMNKDDVPVGTRRVVLAEEVKQGQGRAHRFVAPIYSTVVDQDLRKYYLPYQAPLPPTGLIILEKTSDLTVEWVPDHGELDGLANLWIWIKDKEEHK